MKVKNKKTKKEFEPFSVEVKFDAEEEARLFFHCCNRADLGETLFHTSPNAYNTYAQFAAFFNVDVTKVRNIMEKNGVILEQ